MTDTLQPSTLNWKKYLITVGGPYLALLILAGVCCLFSEQFRNPHNLLNITRQCAYSGMIALGMTVVIIGGGIDLSVGSLVALCGVVSMMTLRSVPGNATALAAAIAVSVGLGVGGGALNGLIVEFRVPPFIATLGTMSIYRSLALYFANAGLVSNQNELFAQMGKSYLWVIPFPTVVLLVLTVLFWLLMSRTAFGRHVCAVGANERVAKFAGIPVGRVKFLTYVLVGLTVGISAVLLGGRTNGISSTGAGLAYELDAIAAVIIGGTAMAGGRGSVWGTLAGVFILGMVSNALDMYGVSANLQGAVKGLVIIIAVLIQQKERER